MRSSLSKRSGRAGGRASNRSTPTIPSRSSTYNSQDEGKSNDSNMRQRRLTVGSVSTIMTRLSILTRRVLEATDRPAEKRYRLAHDPNYVARRDARGRHPKDQRMSGATVI